MENLPVIADAVLEDARRFVTFNIGNELFGVDIITVDSIISPQPLTTIPRTPDYFLGIINLRGEVISIVDMRTLFGIERRENTLSTRIVVVLSNGIKIGMVVDVINAIEIVDDKDVQVSPHMTTSDRQKFVSGSFKLPDEKVVLILLQNKIIDEQAFYIQKELTYNQDVIDTAPKIREPLVREIPLVCFSINNENYTIESAHIDEIIFLPEMTNVPDMEDFVEGIFYLRDSAIPIIRLGERLGLKRRDLTPDDQVIILKKDLFGIRIGMIVESISEVFFIKENELINSPINLNKRQTEHLKGVFKMNRDENTLIVMLLNLEKLFTFEEQYKLKKLDTRGKRAETDSKKVQTNIGILEFYIANERYAIRMSDTNEIIQVTDIVPIPKAPPYIRGIVNLRGEVISIIGLSLLVDNTEQELTKEAKVLIVKAGADVSGLLVEKVIGIRRVPPTLFEPPSDLLRQKGNIFIEGIGKIKETNEIVVLMDIETTLRQAQTETEKFEDEEDFQAVLQELELLERQGETV